MSADAQKLASLRELLPATGAGIYLDTASAGPLPAETAAAMREADEWELRVGRAVEGRNEDVRQRDAEARAVIAALIGVEADDVIVGPGRHWAIDLARRLTPARDVTPLVDPLAGARQPVGGGIVDLTWAAGVVPLRAAELGGAAAIFACDRWLLGPEGTAALWLPGGPPFGEPALRLDRLPRTTLLGLARSVGWLEMYVGLEWALERGQRLAQQLLEALAATAGVEVVTPADRPAGIVSFRVPGLPAEEAAAQLRRRVFAIVGVAERLDAVRASVAWFNTEAELDRFAGAVAEVARQRPADG
ncbi:MAG TPA: aminotransferase class V-fold PLP-dependent enzyme [Candidatus Limnocylindria bacterium]|nr:aminotransferase class V-fold PLP-dependent enzyme [Candidatus Limnocylindria bacterium]